MRTTTWDFYVPLYRGAVLDMVGDTEIGGPREKVEVHIPDSFNPSTANPLAAVVRGRTMAVLLEDTRTILLRRSPDREQKTYELIGVVCHDPPDDDRPYPDVNIRFFGTRYGSSANISPRVEVQDKNDGSDTGRGLTVTIKR